MSVRIWVTGLLMSLSLLACEPAYEWHGNNISGAMPELEFRLTGPDGQSVDAQSLRGKPVVVFFGFTSCPDVCPTTLTQLQIVMNKLGSEADNVQVLLISVDPERDSPAVMKAYTAGFGPWLLGLTGEENELENLRKSYGVYASMQSSDEKGQYNVMHSPAVFVFDAQGQARLLFTNVSDSDAVVADIHQLTR